MAVSRPFGARGDDSGTRWMERSSTLWCHDETGDCSMRKGDALCCRMPSLQGWGILSRWGNGERTSTWWCYDETGVCCMRNGDALCCCMPPLQGWGILSRWGNGERSSTWWCPFDPRVCCMRKGDALCCCMPPLQGWGILSRWGNGERSSTWWCHYETGATPRSIACRPVRAEAQWLKTVFACPRGWGLAVAVLLVRLTVLLRTIGKAAQIEREVSQKRPISKGYEHNQDVKRQHAEGKNAPDGVSPNCALLPVFEDHHEWHKNPAENTHTLSLFRHINKGLVITLANYKIICNTYLQIFIISLYCTYFVTVFCPDGAGERTSTWWCHDETGVCSMRKGDALCCCMPPLQGWGMAP